MLASSLQTLFADRGRAIRLIMDGDPAALIISAATVVIIVAVGIRLHFKNSKINNSDVDDEQRRQTGRDVE